MVNKDVYKTQLSTYTSQSYTTQSTNTKMPYHTITMFKFTQELLSSVLNNLYFYLVSDVWLYMSLTDSRCKMAVLPYTYTQTYGNNNYFSPAVYRFYSNFLFLIFYRSTHVLLSLIGAIQILDDDDDDDGGDADGGGFQWSVVGGTRVALSLLWLAPVNNRSSVLRVSLRRSATDDSVTLTSRSSWIGR